MAKSTQRVASKRPRNAQTDLEPVTNTLRASDWIDLNISPLQLRPESSLFNGQCFNWRNLDNPSRHGIWVGVFDNKAVALKQTPTSTVYCDIAQSVLLSEVEVKSEFALRDRLLDYFQCSYDLDDLYQLWGSSCERMSLITERIKGVRVMRQDPWECLISFICSSNNNIKRITQMLDKLRAKYGNYICSIKPTTISSASNSREWVAYRIDSVNESQTDNTNSDESIHFYTFPSVDSLARASEEDLRALGLGYRAKFIMETANMIASKSPDPLTWLNRLRDKQHIANVCKELNITETDPRLQTQAILMEFPGIGRKVADCVALFSLDQSETIPVDTHVWDVCVRDYNPTLANVKSLTPKIYEQVGDIFRQRFVKRAGWAHSVLFAAELPEYKELLPEEMRQAMKEFAEQRKRLKAEQAAAKNSTEQQL